MYYQINSDLKYIDRWLKANKLSLNVAKTEFMVISSRRKLQSLTDYTMNIHIYGVPINQSNQSKSLGLIIDENLSWKAHVHEISKKVSSGIGALKRVRPFVSMHRQCILQLKYTKVLSSHTLIIAALYGMACPSSLVRNFKNFEIVLSEISQNLAMIYTSFRFLLNSLGWDNLSVRRANQKANLMYKCIKNPAQFVSVIRLPQEHRITIFATRRKKLMLPKPRTDYLKRSFSSWRSSMEQSS